MNIIDVIISLTIGLTALIGYHRGFVLSFLGLIKIFLSIFIARITYPYAMNFISQNTRIYNSLNDFIYPKIMDLTSGQGLFSAATISDLIIRLFIILVLYFVINIILSIIIRSIDSLFKLPVLNTLNKTAGLLFGLAKGTLIVFLIYALLTPFILLNNQSLLATNTMESTLGIFFYRPEILTDYLKNNYVNLMNLIGL